MSGETVITIVGNCATEPELRFTPSGKAVANFSVGSTPRTFDKNANEWRDGETLWMRCSVWGDVAENVAESIQRGSRVIVTGRLKQRSYDKDGEKRTVMELDVDEVGPSLKYATVKISKTSRGGGGGGGSFGGGSGGAQSQGSTADPWAAATPAASTEPPF